MVSKRLKGTNGTLLKGRVIRFNLTRLFCCDDGILKYLLLSAASQGVPIQSRREDVEGVGMGLNCNELWTKMLVQGWL